MFVNKWETEIGLKQKLKEMSIIPFLFSVSINIKASTEINLPTKSTNDAYHQTFLQTINQALHEHNN